MKQGTPPSSTKSESKVSGNMSQPTPPSYLRASASSKAKESPSPRPSRAKSVSPDVNCDNSRSIRKSLLLNKPKSGELVLGSQKSKELEETKAVGRPGNRQVAEQFARPRPQRPADPNSKRNEDHPHEKNRELQEKFCMSESLIMNLQAEVLALKAELDKAQGLNVELQSQNKNLTEKLAAAEAKIAAFTTREQIKADVQTKGEFINDLIQKVLVAAYTDIEDVLKFVDWLDGELSSLADERAVLKHFKWPERKADAMREAAIEYRDLKLLQSEISSYKDDTDIPCAAALKKMAGLLDKSERSIQRLIKLRNSVMRSYQELKIPIDWMLDSGIVSKIKKASMNLANVYMKRVTMELESIRNSDRETSQESLLLQGVHFVYRAHQFAGGLDSETLCAFEEIRQRVPGHLGGSQELLAGIASS
ncbi:unnamed protein product [Prunus armeniaca]